MEIRVLGFGVWGPLVGGMGVRESHSLPRVDKAFGHLPTGTGLTGNLDEALEEMVDERFQDFEQVI